MADEQKHNEGKKEAADSGSMEPSGLSESSLGTLLHAAMDFAACAGLVAGLSSDTPGFYKHEPFALTPSKFPRASFELAKRLARPYGELVHAVSRDYDWLLSVVGGAAAADDFSTRLLDIFKQVHKEGVVQRHALGILRSDYMLSSRKRATGAAHGLLQVEINTIATGGAGRVAKLTDMHRYLLQRYGDEMPDLARFMGVSSGPGSSTSDVAARVEGHQSLPPNPARDELAAGLAHAHDIARTSDRSIVLFVIQPRETNLVDQREVEIRLWQKYRVRSVRVTLGFVAEHGRLDEATRTLSLDTMPDGVDVSVVYYRAGYTPGDYPTEAEWDARLMMERSRAIKCPDVAYHIVGMKKVQQALAEPGAVERFAPAADASLLRSTFAGMWSLDASESKGSADESRLAAVIEEACAHPDRFVLKPQREGGGNNVYGEELQNKLRTLAPKELATYILMERIFPAEQECVFVRDGKTITGPGMAEVGIMGVVLGNDEGLLRNVEAGYVVRTKHASSDEGGVASGHAVMSSLYLTEA